MSSNLTVLCMKKNIRKQKEKTNILKKSEQKNLMYKMIVNNKILDLNVRTNAAIKLHDNHLGQHIRKVCLSTGRSRGLISKYKCSRIKWKSYVQEGLVAGIKKSS